MKIEITNEYAPYSKYISAKGKEFLAGIKECWGDWAKISFQTQKNEETELDQTLITIEFKAKRENTIERTPDEVWNTLVDYAESTLSRVRFSNGDYVVGAMWHPANVSTNGPTEIVAGRRRGERYEEWITNHPFKIRLLDSHNQIWSQVGYEDEWFRPLDREPQLTSMKYSGRPREAYEESTLRKYKLI